MQKSNLNLSLLFIVTISFSIFGSESEVFMPESLQDDIKNGELEKVVDHLDKYPNDISLKTKPFADENNFTTNHTALMLAITSDSLPMFSEILNRTNDVNETNMTGNTALTNLPALNKNEENTIIFAEFLLQNGALLDVQNEKKSTALMRAIYFKSFKLAKFLILKNANLNLKGNNGFTALQYIIYIIHYAKSEEIKIEGKEVAKILIQRGVDINATNDAGFTPLVMAIADIDLVEFLINHGADINFIIKHTNKLLYSPLTFAIAANISFEIIELLIERKATLKPIPVVNSAIVPLIDAVNHARFDIVKLLLESGADINEKVFNKTALDFAKEYYAKAIDEKKKQEYRKIIKYLENIANYTRNEARAMFVSTVLDKHSNIIPEITDLIVDYIHEPVKTDDVDINELKTYLRKSTLPGIEALLKRLPNVVLLTDEAGDTPLVLMVKYYAYDKYYKQLTQEDHVKAISILIAILQSLKKVDKEALQKQLLIALNICKKLKLPDITKILNQYLINPL